MDSITVLVSDLARLVQELQEDGMKYVSLSISPAENGLPADLSASGTLSKSSPESVEYDPVEASDYQF